MLHILLCGASDALRAEFAAACARDGNCVLLTETELSNANDADAVVFFHAATEREQACLANSGSSVLYIAPPDLPPSPLCFWAQDVMHGEPDWERALFRLKRMCGIDAAQPLQLDAMIAHVLRELSVPERQLGFMYIRIAIEMLLQADSAPLHLSQDIYPALAKVGASTPRMAEKCVNHSVFCAWKDGDVSVQRAFFGYSREERADAPTNAAFLYAVAERIRLFLLHVLPER
ncbi:MAG: sporulation initiation factor Spo0A C-terminal domain-containing protein [Clostridiales bacterium]|nr:sporulation initiation factor Spo0A C-terminal domain-containing protein [Clostridiales bacterium]